MNIQTVKLEQQRSVIASMIASISAIEETAAHAVPASGDRFSVAEQLAQLRHYGQRALNDKDITEAILAGYRQDAVDSGEALLELITCTANENMNMGKGCISDEQLHFVAVAAQSFSDRASQYLNLKTSASEASHD